jgi:ADP-ribosylglycohydrolase
MIGAVIGDVVGSIYEWNNKKSTEFDFLVDTCHFTDDTVMSVALADAILTNRPYADVMREYGAKYPDAGYGGFFRTWLTDHTQGPYDSYGNGAGMRISPAAWAYETLQEVLHHATAFTAATHSHPEGIKGGQAVAAAIFLARKGDTKPAIKKYIEETFGYDLDRTCDDIRPDYKFKASCQETIPEAIICFMESTDFESAVRLAISLGGDSDTLAAIAGSIAQAFYTVPAEHIAKIATYLDDDLKRVINEFYMKYITHDEPIF